MSFAHQFVAVSRAAAATAAAKQLRVSRWLAAVVALDAAAAAAVAQRMEVLQLSMPVSASGVVLVVAVAAAAAYCKVVVYVEEVADGAAW